MAVALPFFAVTLFISAFLLFLVQPMIGKMILPRLGGTPQVWNTCMVFFQTALLAGYFYTHAVSTRLSLRRQLLIHGILLLVPLAILLPNSPFNITGWIPPPGANPILSTLGILTVVVGVPFFVVATSAPLLQKWFSYTGHPAAKDPYFLYGASNLGSILGLLAYPVIVEPQFRLRAVEFDPLAQNWIWTIGYVLLVFVVWGCALMVVKAPPGAEAAGSEMEPPPAEIPPAPPPEPVTQIKATPPPSQPRSTGIKKGSKQRGRGHTQRSAAKTTAPATQVTATPPRAAAPVAPRPFEMTWYRRLRWVGLAAVPSSLMLGIITYISTDISAIPLFWVIPLALYLLTFVLVFMRWPVVWTDIPHKIVLYVQPLLLLLLVWMMVRGGGFNPLPAILVCVLCFFSTALLCHGELARDRPPTRYLTEFYLWMSVGGMVGGIFNGIFAPLIFVGVVELPLALVFAGLLRPPVRDEGWTEQWTGAIFPSFSEWVGDKGDEIARNMQKSDTPEGTPPRRVELPPRGWILSYALDVLLPILLGVVFLWVVTKASARTGWNWRDLRPHMQVLRQNPLFMFWHETIGMNPERAHWWAQLAFQVLVFGLPLLICFLYFPRPLRFGLGVGALLLASTMYQQAQEDQVLYADRSYFGVLRVRESVDRDEKGQVMERYTYLMHGTTHHGLNYHYPEKWARVATTYYHRYGPVGEIMRPIDWFPAPRPSAIPKPAPPKDPTDTRAKQRFKEEEEAYNNAYVEAHKHWNTYWADARMPTSLLGSAAMPTPGALGSPLTMFPLLVGAWSEPAYATIGLGTGTMASYSRPFQHVVFYEIDDQIRRLSLQDHTWPDGSQGPFFTYLRGAMGRGSQVEVIMGDARLSMAQELAQPGTYLTPKRQNYYRMMVVDAFSSDAIPVHLITREAIEMYFDKLVKPQKVGGKRYRGGVLMVHTSNRHVDLVKPVTDVAKSLGLAWRVGKDGYDRGRLQDPSDRGRFSSEYVMLARDEADLPPPSTDREIEAYRKDEQFLIWTTPRAPGMRVWTDDFSNLLSVFRW
ncbi:MAG: hypothetical protein L0Z62_42755 [Gemmataceae bacterium]|nr:hypothetical protein [Gemmataceae bacterium]